MGSLNQILAREMSKSKGRASIVPKYDGGNVSPYLEWKKWLSYVPEFERKGIEYFDSKKISEKKREMLYEQITNEAISYGIGIINQKEIDEINILQATKKGLTEAIKDMENKLAEKPELGIIKPDAILVDALTKIDTDGIPYKSIIHGDAISYSIACASIIAKVTRDRIMRQWDEIYSQYGFAKHKGYGTAAHIKALKEYGPCPLHRASFIKNFI